MKSGSVTPEEASRRIQNAERLLLVALGTSLSELLATTPVIGNLRAALPRAELRFLTDLVGAPAVLDHPALAEIWIVPGSGFGNSFKRRMLSRRIRSHRPDVLLSLSSFPPPPPALSFLRSLHAGLSVGLDDVSGAESSPQYDCVVTAPEDGNMVDYHLALLEGLGLPVGERLHHLEVTTEQHARGRELLRAAGLTNDRPILGVFAGGTPRHPERQWPPSYYAAVLQRAALELGYQVVLLGSSDDLPALDAVQSLGKAAIPRLLDLSFMDAKGVLAELDFFLTHDGDMVHVAAGVGVPSYFVFLSSPAWKWAPYGGHVAVWAEPDRAPTSAEVWAVMRPLLEQRSTDYLDRNAEIGGTRW